MLKVGNNYIYITVEVFFTNITLNPKKWEKWPIDKDYLSVKQRNLYLMMMANSIIKRFIFLPFVGGGRKKICISSYLNEFFVCHFNCIRMKILGSKLTVARHYSWKWTKRN